MSSEKKMSFEELLEEEASNVSSDSSTLDGRSITEALEQEIALTLEHLERLRSFHKTLEHKLLQLELSVDTDLLQLEPRPHDSVDRHRSERLSLKDRILRIELERQRLSKEQLEKEQAFQNHLFMLMKKLKLIRR